MRKPPQPIRREKTAKKNSAPSKKPASTAPDKTARATASETRGKSARTVKSAAVTKTSRNQATVGPTKVIRREERFVEKARMERRLTLRRLFFIFLAIVAVTAGSWVVFFSSVFDLREPEIAIVGAEHPVSPEEVEQVVHTDVGQPLARLDLDEIGERVSGVRGVSNAIVRREWPHGLRVSVVPRVPVAAVENNEMFVLLDAEGEEVGEVEEAPEDVAVASVPLDEDRERVLQSVLTVLDAIPDELREEIADIGAESPDTVQFTLEDGSVVEWGSADDSKLKASVLQVLREQGAAIYDVSATSLPVTREK